MNSCIIYDSNSHDSKICCSIKKYFILRIFDLIRFLYYYLLNFNEIKLVDEIVEIIINGE